MQGADFLALTKLDVLSYLDRIPVCVAYEIDGQRTDSFPVGERLDRARPVIEYMDGFGDVSACRTAESLPIQARAYIARLESMVDCPIRYVSVGADRESYIKLF